MHKALKLIISVAHKIGSCNYNMYYERLMVTTGQKPIIDTQIIKRIKENHFKKPAYKES